MSLLKWILRSGILFVATLAVSTSHATAFVGPPPANLTETLSGPPGCLVQFDSATSGVASFPLVTDVPAFEFVEIQSGPLGSLASAGGGIVNGMLNSSCFNSFVASFSLNGQGLSLGTAVPTTFAAAFDIEINTTVTLASGVTGTGPLAGIPTGVPVDITISIASSIPGDPNGAPVPSLTFALATPPAPNPPGVRADLTEW